MNPITNGTGRARDMRRYDKFIETLNDTGNITASCMVAGLSRRAVYDFRKESPEFAARWETALEIATDKLEYIARNRAELGVKRPIHYKGEVVDHVYEPSDRLMELLLKAHRPDKFNPNPKLDVSGSITVEVVQFQASSAGSVTYSGEAVRIEDSSNREGGHFEGGTPKDEAAEKSDPFEIADFSNLKP